MKCPKCGYTSFESYDACKKCAADLVEFKQTHGLTPLVLPNALRVSMAAELLGGQTSDATGDDTGNDMFSFELPTEQTAASAAAVPVAPADPFAFNDTPAPAAPAFSFDHAPVVSQEDPFAALLEATAQPAAAPQPEAASQGFELNNFSWDDAPVPGQVEQPQPDGKSDDDDFNSLFGELGSADKK